jgi:hypothetical protein
LMLQTDVEKRGKFKIKKTLAAGDGTPFAA